VSDRGRHPEWSGLAREYERSRIRDRFSIVLVLLIITVFFSISAPNTPWVWLATTVTLAASLMIAMVASGAQPKVVRAGLTLAGIGLAQSIVVVLTQGDSRRYLSVTSLVFTLQAMGAIARRLTLHTEINVLTVMGAVCLYVLLGLAFAFAFECVGEFGSRPFFTSQEAGTRSDYVYFSFTTMATVGYGDLIAQGGVGRALAVIEGIFGQIYLVTAVAALVGNLGRRRAPLQEADDKASEEETRSG
jgi:hypothetical protein